MSSSVHLSLVIVVCMIVEHIKELLALHGICHFFWDLHVSLRFSRVCFVGPFQSCLVARSISRRFPWETTLVRSLLLIVADLFLFASESPERLFADLLLHQLLAWLFYCAFLLTCKDLCLLTLFLDWDARVCDFDRVCQLNVFGLYHGLQIYGSYSMGYAHLPSVHKHGCLRSRYLSGLHVLQDHLRKMTSSLVTVRLIKRLHRREFVWHRLST